MNLRRLHLFLFGTSLGLIAISSIQLAKELTVLPVFQLAISIYLAVLAIAALTKPEGK